jgi:hypothetical protein
MLTVLENNLRWVRTLYGPIELRNNSLSAKNANCIVAAVEGNR